MFGIDVVFKVVLDGYIIVILFVGVFVISLSMEKVVYDVLVDLMLVMLIVIVLEMLVVVINVLVKNIGELIVFVKV